MCGALDAASGHLASWVRAGMGGRVVARGPRPSTTLELYEFESCPFCRKVREALSALDLEAVIYPCPKGGTRFRPEVQARGGREQFPYLVDRGRGAALYESDAIVAHLFAHYGTSAPPLGYRGGLLNGLGVTLASAARLWAGSRARPAKRPERPLALFACEPAPHCRRVREILCGLELPYRSIPVAIGSAHRSPAGCIPHLVDANSGARHSGGRAIVDYLRSTYQVA